LQAFETAIDMSCQDIASIEAMSVRSPCARRQRLPGALRADARLPSSRAMRRNSA
jgi:hypothetical protein